MIVLWREWKQCRPALTLAWASVMKRNVCFHCRCWSSILSELSNEFSKLTWTHCQTKLSEDSNHLFNFNIVALECVHRLCVLLKRIEANPCNKSHPFLCYCKLNYIIESSSRCHVLECGEVSTWIPWTVWMKMGIVFSQVEGGTEGGQCLH